MDNNMLKATDMLYAWQIADGVGKCWPGRRKEEKEEEAPKWSGKRSGKCDEAEESNSWKGSKHTNMAKSDWERVSGVTLEN